MLDTLNIFQLGSWPLLLAGLLIGMAFGWLVAKSNFCVMGALSDAVTFGNLGRLKAWFTAIGMAMLIVALSAALLDIDFGRAHMMQPSFGLFSILLGGLVFGAGMVIAGGCISRNLVYAGGGDMGAATVLLVTALAALALQWGILVDWRLALEQAYAVRLESFGLTDANIIGLVGGKFAQHKALTAAMISGVILLLSLRGWKIGEGKQGAALLIGTLIGLAWIVNGLAFDPLLNAPPLRALNFIEPLANLGRFEILNFAFAAALGTIIGGAGFANRQNSWRAQNFGGWAQALRGILGGAMMGTGGVLAMGCTTGQGMSGLSTLSISAILATLATVLGAIITIKLLEWRA